MEIAKINPNSAKDKNEYIDSLLYAGYYKDEDNSDEQNDQIQLRRELSDRQIKAKVYKRDKAGYYSVQFSCVFIESKGFISYTAHNFDQFLHLIHFIEFSIYSLESSMLESIVKRKI